MYDDNTMRKGKQAYVQTQFTTVNQGEVLLMLYDGALKFMAQAKERMLAGDVAGKGLLISKTLDVITELGASLNQEVGGELARNLFQLYLVCNAKLLRANMNQDPTLVDEVAAIISGLRSAYAEILPRPEAQTAAQQISERQADVATRMARPASLPVTAQPTGIGRAQAHAAYGQSACRPAPRPVGPKI